MEIDIHEMKYIDIRCIEISSIYDITKMEKIGIRKKPSIKENNDFNTILYNWIELNCKDVWTRSSKSHSSYTYYHFFNKEDAILFKLTWNS